MCCTKSWMQFLSPQYNWNVMESYVRQLLSKIYAVKPVLRGHL